MWLKLTMTFLFSFCFLNAGFMLSANQPLVRIKDIARLEGARTNQLIGTGLVIGLGGTGDKTNLTKSMVLNTMNNLGMKVDQGSMSPKNSAAVIITAELPPFKIGRAHV